MGSLFANSLSQELLALDVMSMTPIEAMNALFRLQQEAKRSRDCKKGVPMQEAEVRLLDTNTSNQIAAGEVVENRHRS